MPKSVLLPIDLSSQPSWAKALPAAIELGGANMTLHVLTVIPDFGMSVVGSFFDQEFEKRALHEVGETLSAWIAANVPEGVEAHPHVLHGRIYDEIIAAAEKLDVDAIVLASHTPELSDYLLGPNAARVVRHSSRSVFVVRGA